MSAPLVALAGAGPEAAGRLAALHAASFAAPWSAEAMADLAADAHVFAFVSSGDTGFVLARAVAGEAEILTLAVAPAQRRRGVGRALMRAALDEAARRGAGAAFLEVDRRNAAALGLYRGLGFGEVGRRRGYYAGGDALVLRRALDAADGAAAADDRLQCAPA